MNLSADGQNVQKHLQFLKSRSRSVSPSPSVSRSDLDIETIDISSINFGNDESWLCTLENCPEEQIPNLSEWLHNDLELNDDFLADRVRANQQQTDPHKIIDTRTFTRPKKRFTRPSIERYNEEMYGSGSETNPSSLIKNKLINRPLSESYVIQEKNETVTPVEFDLSQPSCSFYFDKIAAESGQADSFQNMSPPSLVNSMCSSMFANLMESSFIKNDPVLREIRDTDFTEQVLLQDSEPPMFQSITESCSSINSDTPELFLKKVSFNGTFKKTATKDLSQNGSCISNTPDVSHQNYQEIDETHSASTIGSDSREPNTQTNYNLNGTYRRTPKKDATFKKSDVRDAKLFLNSICQKNDSDHNSTQTLIEESSMNSFKTTKSYSNTLIRDNDTVEDLKKLISNSPKISPDLNRLSYCVDSTFTKEENLSNRSGNLKQSPLGCSSGSADSLDRMSSSMSSSSRGSNKMLNMADVDAIVEMQERSLQQVMSTPKPNAAPKRIWDNNFISPIINTEQTSDSDFSSNDEYKSVRSTSSKTSLDNYLSKPTKSLDSLAGPVDTKIKTNRKSTYTISRQKPLQVIPTNVRNSYSNLKSVQSNIPGSQSNLTKSSSARVSSTTSNLKTMGARLKGSYTSLRPISSNLPVAPPLVQDLDSTVTLPKASNPNVTQNIETRPKVVEVLPMRRETVTIVGDNTFVKPQPPKASGLPRPTGIPRPASRIPGPRSSNIRPISSRPGK